LHCSIRSWNVHLRPEICMTLTRTMTATAVLVALVGSEARAAEPAPARSSGGTSPAARTMRLEECLAEAMQNNRRRPVSRLELAAAEAQHRQALAGYWPQVVASAGYQHLSNSPDFLFPASSVQLHAGSAVITVPAGVLGPAAVQLPVSTPAQTVSIPAQDVKLLNPDILQASLRATWLLYDGGMRKGLRDQTGGLVDAMKQEVRRADLEITESVTRLYHGALLARQVRQVGQDALARLEGTLTLTEAMYKAGSGKAMKTDWLDAKVMVETVRALLATLEKNEAMAESALANTVGLPARSRVTPADGEVPVTPFAGSLDDLVDAALRANPDWLKVQAGLAAAQGAVRTAASEYFPKLAAMGELHHWWNSYDAGMATSRNKEGWSAGVGLELPLFSGFLTRNKVDEARAREAKLEEQQSLLKDGIALQLEDAFLGLRAAATADRATREAMNAAIESRELTVRAYQNGIIETDKVIRAQLMEALMSAQHFKARYDHAALQARIALLVGAPLENARRVP
jgi:outer membrane protein TolC